MFVGCIWAAGPLCISIETTLSSLPPPGVGTAAPYSAFCTARAGRVEQVQCQVWVELAGGHSQAPTPAWLDWGAGPCIKCHPGHPALYHWAAQASVSAVRCTLFFSLSPATACAGAVTSTWSNRHLRMALPPWRMCYEVVQDVTKSSEISFFKAKCSAVAQAVAN